MKIYVEHDDGTRIDVTTGVQVAYDGITASLDWGSGFLATDEARAIQTLAVACGFDVTSYSDGELCATCGHGHSWHSFWGPNGPEKRCRGLKGEPLTSWMPVQQGREEDRCECVAFTSSSLPTLEELARKGTMAET